MSLYVNLQNEAEAASGNSVPVAGDTVLQFQESTFSSGQATGKMTGNNRPGTSDANFTTPLAGGANSGPEGGHPAARGSMFSINYYRPYFDVDTVDVLGRIKDSFIPISGDFVEKNAANPDLYGPFWICTTLIFVTAALGNFATFLSFKPTAAEPKWHYDINKVSYGSAIFYGYIGVIPLLLFFVMKYYRAAIGLVQLWCLYGYSLAVFIPITFLCVIPIELARWGVVAAACLLSTLFLALNIRGHILHTTENWYLVVLAVVALHLALGLVLKLYFFTYFSFSL
ncbi:hypothetical protein KFL_000830190 [Klebsormidium nitens]|uniref:Protein YIP n=1 Tax=Klebsormidium nitens TaxID=105231 RepID=A0A1Y1HYD0_KLENI|nr:hypothetical protein KFL_000830190 [Klebsormidium nitens]|eukprot:GAQ81537.1 hypothetical protein KFL_000830190 [Klebsormidium nitens]